MAQYVQKAVDELAQTYDDKLRGELDLVETDEGGSITLISPAKILKARAPARNISPLLQIYETSWDRPEAGTRNDLVHVQCRVVLTYIGTTDLEANEEFMRRYVTALIKTIENNSTLQDTVAAAIVQRGNSGVTEIDDSTTRMVSDLEVLVLVHSP